MVCIPFVVVHQYLIVFFNIIATFTIFLIKYLNGGYKNIFYHFYRHLQIYGMPVTI